ncbi:MAG: hypothetical protein L6R42_003413 [Xanthoria sp. 1 TBL-2021]|nr:MAG: hypothetical protein L6R42_003413 [Xanthoria sp. 1 TBL-2021]
MDFHDPGSITELHAASRQHVQNYTAPISLVGNEYQQQAHVPSPAIFETPESAHTDEDKRSNMLPSIAQCAIHLELLECFKLLQKTVIKSNQLDVLFDTLPRKKFTTSYIYNSRGRGVPGRRLLRPIKAHDSTFQERRKEKWTRFIHKAYCRFSTWVVSINNNRKISGKVGHELDLKLVPPIDVMLIWHAFMLKPRLCLAWCLEKRIPWHSMINQTNRRFEIPVGNAEAFREMTELEPGLLQCLIEGPKGGLPDGGQASSMQSVRPKSLDMIWQNHDEWVDLMCHFLWIKSPAVEFTLQSARDRYCKFFGLLASNPAVSLAPTPDIELVWLTHQLSPSSFGMFSETSVGHLVEYQVVPHDHDHQQALISIERAFRARFGARYRRCLCWDCQNLQRLAEKSLFDNKDTRELVQESMQEVAYHRAVEAARRNRRTLRKAY